MDETQQAIDRLRKAYPERPAPPPSKPFWSGRIAAGVVDLLGLLAVSELLATFLLRPVLANQATFVRAGVLGDLAADAAAHAIALLLVALSIACVELSSGRSPGKLLCGLHVIDGNGHRLSFAMRLGRHALRWAPIYLTCGREAWRCLSLLGGVPDADLPGVLLGIAAVPIQIGWLGVLAGRPGGTLHDWLLGTRVIDPRLDPASDPTPAFEVVRPAE